MAIPNYVANVSPFGGSAGGISIPAVGNDGNIWWCDFANIEWAAPNGLSPSGYLMPSSWSAANLTGFTAPDMIPAGSGHLWMQWTDGAFHSNSDFMAYYNPSTTANGVYNVGGRGSEGYKQCMGPSSLIYAATLRAFVTTYALFSSSRSSIGLSGAVSRLICSDLTNVYVSDDATSTSAIWVITSGGVATKYTPAISGNLSAMCLGSDGNLWCTSPGAGSTVNIYKISTSGSLLASYNITVPVSGTMNGATLHSDGHVWFNSGNNYLVDCPTSGPTAVWSLNNSGLAVANTSGNYSGIGAVSGTNGNLYVSGQVPPATVSYLLEVQFGVPNNIVMIACC